MRLSPPAVWCLLVISVLSSMGCARGLLRLGPASADVVSKPVSLCPPNKNVQQIGRLAYRGGVVLTWPGRTFGGWSDLAITQQGQNLLAISDEGHWLSARLNWSNAGLTALHDGRLGVLPGEDCPGKLACDSESFALMPDGWLVGFERKDRLRLFAYTDPPFAQAARAFALPPGLHGGGNDGLETLAGLPDGRLLAIAEGPETGDPHGVAAWIWQAGAWKETEYPTVPWFRPTGASWLEPDPMGGDRVVVVERYWRLGQSRSRIVQLRVPPAKEALPVSLQVQELAQLAEPESVDNFEGITAWEQGGERRIALLSDDNFQGSQRTLLMTFAVVGESKKDTCRL